MKAEAKQMKRKSVSLIFIIIFFSHSPPFLMTEIESSSFSVKSHLVESISVSGHLSTGSRVSQQSR